MIRKAVIPAAGFGTRFLPATKAQPKEMLPIVDTPTVQFVVEEAVKSGIGDILLVTGRGKTAIENHFDRTYELEDDLRKRGKLKQLKEVKDLAELANMHYIRQRELKGLGDAIGCARDHVGGEYFVVLLGDTIIDSEIPCTRQLIDVHNRVKASVIGVERVPKEKVSRYGIIAGDEVEPGLYKVTGLVEKPSEEEAPSDLAIGGRYILPPEIFDAIDSTLPGYGGEIQITDAVRLVLESVPIYAYVFEGKRHDIGNRLDYLKTIVEFACRRTDVGADFKEFLRAFVKGL